MVIGSLDHDALGSSDPGPAPTPPRAPRDVEPHRQKVDDTASYIDARITHRGELEVGAAEIGKRPREFWGFNDYEWEVTVSPEHRDEVLLALIEALYAGNPGAVDAFAELLDARGIPYEFTTWRSDPA